jgi:hypothetical protein
VNEAVQLSKAHSHLFILQQFNRGIQNCADHNVAGVLTLARNLYALSNIENDFGKNRPIFQLLMVTKAFSEIMST